MMSSRLYHFLGSNKFRIFILTFIALQAVYIALTCAYPMLYDEGYHFQVTREFSHHILPYLGTQPSMLDIFGNIGGLVQTIYHYLLSFPLRIIEFFTSSEAVQVVLLRMINIGLFISGLVLSARLLKLMKVSPIIQNIAIAFVGMLPVSVFIAATINYDNLLFPVVIYTLIVAVSIIKKRDIAFNDLLKLVAIIAFGSLIKISYLPVGAAVGIYVLVNFYLRHKNGQDIRAQLIKTARIGNQFVRNSLLSVLLILIGYVGYHFTANLVTYGRLSPSCKVQLSEARCGNSTLEQRYRHYIETKNGVPSELPQYLVDWYGTMQRDALSFNTIRVTSTPVAVAPLPVIYILFFVAVLVIGLSTAIESKRLFQSEAVRLFFLSFAVYTLALLYTNIKGYYETYIPLAIQARYLLPFMVVFVGLGIYSLNKAISARVQIKSLVAVCVLVVYIWGGAGVVTYISRSNTAWYWENTVVRGVASHIKSSTQPFIKEWWY